MAYVNEDLKQVSGEKSTEKKHTQLTWSSGTGSRCCPLDAARSPTNPTHEPNFIRLSAEDRNSTRWIIMEISTVAVFPAG